MPVGALVFQTGTQGGQFFATTDGGLGRQMLIDGLVRQRRAVLPDFIEYIDIGTQTRATLGQLATQGACRGHGHDRTVHRHHATLRGLLSQPLQRPRLTRLQLHQLDTAALEFLGRLFPVTAIRPDPGKLRRDDQGAHRTMKAGQPLTPLPVTRQIFGQVRVRRWHQQGMNAFAAHQFTGVRQALGNRSMGQRLRTHCVSC